MSLLLNKSPLQQIWDPGLYPLSPQHVPCPLPMKWRLPLQHTLLPMNARGISLPPQIHRSPVASVYGKSIKYKQLIYIWLFRGVMKYFCNVTPSSYPKFHKSRSQGLLRQLYIKKPQKDLRTSLILSERPRMKIISCVVWSFWDFGKIFNFTLKWMFVCECSSGTQG